MTRQPEAPALPTVEDAIWWQTCGRKRAYVKKVAWQWVK